MTGLTGSADRGVLEAVSEVSLRQIAEKVGCSRAAVSYALRNSPNISEEKRDRILKVARELGWRPDAALAKQMALIRGSLERHDLPKLAIVVNKRKEALETELSLGYRIEGAIRYADIKGYSVDTFYLPEQPMRAERFSSILEARGVEGVVFIASMDPEIPVAFMEACQGFACTVTGIRYPDVPYHVVMPDYLGGCRLVVANLRRRGYRRIGSILPRGVDEPLGFAFTGGLASGLIELDEADQLRVQHVGRTENRVPDYEYDRVAQWLKRNRPDSVVTTDVWGVYQLLQPMGPPFANLPVYSLDWFPNQRGMARGGLDQLAVSMGEAAVDLVVAQIHRGERGLPRVQRSINIEGVWADAEESADASNESSEESRTAI